MTGPLPQFLVIGAMKAGTTSLHHYLQAHPDLYLPKTKELNFFRDAAAYARGEQWYRAHFADAEPHQVPGEVSPDYTKHPHHQGAPERIVALCPDVRLVYVLRHPIERMRSMYVHQLVAGRERRSVDEALLQDEHYLQVSQYAMQLERYLAHFHRDQILLCSSEELAADRGAVLARIHRFVGVAERPDTGTAVDGEWYRGDERRRRGTLGRVTADHHITRTLFTRLPAPVRDTVRRLGSRPVAESSRQLAPETVAELKRRLLPDLHRLRAHAPEVVSGWRLLP